MDITKTTTESAGETVIAYAGPTGLRAIVRRDHATFAVSVESVRSGRTVGMDRFGRGQSRAERFAVEFVTGQH